jgi:TPR repeat protein
MDQNLFEHYRRLTTEGLRELISQPEHLTEDARVAAIAALEERQEVRDLKAIDEQVATGSDTTATQRKELNLREVGLAQRLLIWGVLTSILGVFPILLVAVVPLLLYCTWRILSALQLDNIAKVFCILLMVVPLANSITLLVLNRKATRALQSAGIKVGLMGAKPSDLPTDTLASLKEGEIHRVPEAAALASVDTAVVHASDPEFSERPASTGSNTYRKAPHWWGRWYIALPVVLLAFVWIFYVVSSEQKSEPTSVASEKPEQKLALLTKKAEAGDVSAQYDLALRYFRGDGVVQDYIKAGEWARKAAEQGNADAQALLGVMYSDGTGVAKSDVNAVEWSRKSAEQGNALGQYLLGYVYSTGQGVPKNAVKAVEWYQKAAEQGYARAQYLLGYVYSTGQGVPKNALKAVEWFQKAAAQGFDEAEDYLGFIYLNGNGVPKDAVKALEWYQKAAAQGNTSAQVSLGYMYANGIGVPKDMVLSYAWSNLAAIGNETAVKNRNAFESMMTQSDIAEAQRLSSSWKKGQLLVR